MEAKELADLGAVRRVLVNAVPESISWLSNLENKCVLQVLGELLVELLVVLLVLRDLGEELDALLHEVLADNLKSA